MAISHRKLFPYLTSNPNQTDCPSNINCDPPCSYDDCYLYPPDPVFFAPPPQLSTATDATAAVEESDRISPYVIIGVVTLVALFVLVTYYAVVVKCGWFSRAPRGDDANPLGSNDGDENEGGGGVHHVDHFDDPMVHPIWFITTVGLQQSIINAITVIRYKRNDGLIEGTDCSVCLSEFQEGETLRLLPKCSHAFHINCIDVWLRSHTNCPLCRTTIVLNPGRPSLASTDQSFGNSRRTEVTQFEESEFGVTESENSQIGNSRGGEGQNGEVIIFDGDQLIKVDDHDDGVNNRRIGRSVSMEFLRTRLMSFRMSRSYSWSERIFSTRQSRSSNSSILL